METELKQCVCRAFRFFFLYVLVSGKIPDEKPGVVSHDDWEKLKLWKSVGIPPSFVSVRDADGKDTKLLEVKCSAAFLRLSFARALSGKTMSKRDDYDELCTWLKNIVGNTQPKNIYGTYQDPTHKHITSDTIRNLIQHRLHVNVANAEQIELVTLSYRISHKLFFHPIIQNLPPDNSISVVIRSILWNTILNMGVLGAFDFGIMRTHAGFFKRLTLTYCNSSFNSSMEYAVAQLDAIRTCK